MKALLFVAILIPSVCYARPREAEAERVSAEKKSAILSEVVSEIKSRRSMTATPCRFTINVPKRSQHQGRCTHFSKSEASAKKISEGWHCVTPDNFPCLRSVISNDHGDCPINTMPVDPEIKVSCDFEQDAIAVHIMDGTCGKLPGDCTAPANSLQQGDPSVTGYSPACVRPAPPAL